jgi:hypothetical protein
MLNDLEKELMKKYAFNILIHIAKNNENNMLSE